MIKMLYLDDDSGYDLNDPKHPTFPERMADHVDELRKREKEESPEPEDLDHGIDDNLDWDTE